MPERIKFDKITFTPGGITKNTLTYTDAPHKWAADLYIGKGEKRIGVGKIAVEAKPKRLFKKRLFTVWTNVDRLGLPKKKTEIEKRSARGAIRKIVKELN